MRRLHPRSPWWCHPQRWKHAHPGCSVGGGMWMWVWVWGLGRQGKAGSRQRQQFRQRGGWRQRLGIVACGATARTGTAAPNRGFEKGVALPASASRKTILSYCMITWHTQDERDVLQLLAGSSACLLSTPPCLPEDPATRRLIVHSHAPTTHTASCTHPHTPSPPHHTLTHLQGLLGLVKNSTGGVGSGGAGCAHALACTVHGITQRSGHALQAG